MVTQVLIYADPHVITAGEVVAGLYESYPLQGPCDLVNIVVNSTNVNTYFDAVISKIGSSANLALTLFQNEYQRAASTDIIWEGRRYLPLGWTLIIRVYGIVAGDILSIHGAYEFE